MTDTRGCNSRLRKIKVLKHTCKIESKDRYCNRRTGKQVVKGCETLVPWHLCIFHKDKQNSYKLSTDTWQLNLQSQNRLLIQSYWNLSRWVDGIMSFVVSRREITVGLVLF